MFVFYFYFSLMRQNFGQLIDLYIMLIYNKTDEQQIKLLREMHDYI